MVDGKLRVGLGFLLGFVLLGIPCALSAVTTPAQAAVVPEWVSEPQMGENLTQAAVVYDGADLVYVMGGVDDISYTPVLDTAYSYNTTSGEWIELVRMPVGVRGAASALGNDGRIYVFSGANASTVSNTQIYNPANNTWTSGAPVPTPVWEAKAATTSEGIFVVGGEGSGGAVNMYDPALDSWTPKATMPSVVLSGALISDGTYLYYFGGSDSLYSPVSTSYIYTSWDAWSTLAPMPAPVAATSGAIGSDGLMYVIGGGPYASNGGAAYSSGYAYNRGSNEWMTIPNMAVASKYLGVVATSDNRILALGGNENEVFSRVESMTIMTSAITLSSTSVAGGDNILVTMNYEFAFVVPTGYSGYGYLQSSANVTYGRTQFSAPLGTGFGFEIHVPDAVPPGQYELVIPQILVGPYGLKLPSYEATISVVDAPTVQEQIDMLKANISALQAMLMAMAQGQAAATAELNATLADLQAQLDDFQTQIDRLENKADTGGMISLLTLALIVVVIALLFVVVMMARRKPPMPPPPV